MDILRLLTSEFSILETSRARQWAPQALRGSKGLLGPRWNALTQPNSLMTDCPCTGSTVSSAPVPRLRHSTEIEISKLQSLRSFLNLNHTNRTGTLDPRCW